MHTADSCQAHAVADTYLEATGIEKLGVVGGVGVVEAEGCTGSLGSYPWGNMLKSVSAVKSLATSVTVRPMGPPMSRFSCNGIMPALHCKHTSQVTC